MTTAAWTETPANYLINGLVKLLADGRPADARVAVAKADEELFSDAVDRDLFRALRRAVDFCAAPGPLEVRFLIERDEEGGSPVHDVVLRLQKAVAASASVGWEHHIDSSIQHLQAEQAIRQARELGRELAGAATKPTPDRCEDIIRLARRIQDGMTAGNGSGGATLVQIVERWRANLTEKLITTGFGPIDRPLGGGLPVGLHGIAASPGAGKSALAIQLAAGVLLHNPDARVVWMRGEMTNDLLFSRLLACWSNLRDDTIFPITVRDALKRSPESEPAYRDILEFIADRLIVVDPPVTPSAVERWIDEARPSLVVVDYLQKVECVGFKDRRAELDHAVRRLSNASTRADIPIVVVSAVAKGTGEHSEIGTLTKESNQLDFEAHSYWSLWPHGEKHDRPRRVLLKNNKSRSGEMADDELWFHGAGQVYEPAANPIYEEFGAFSPK
jgi:hypothetical protein